MPHFFDILPILQLKCYLLCAVKRKFLALTSGQYDDDFMDEQEKVFERTIVIAYRPPRWLPVYLLITLTGAFLSVFLADIPWVYRAASALIHLLAARAALRIVKAGPMTLLLDRHDQWFVVHNDKQTRMAQLISATILLPDFIVLVLRTKESRDFSYLLTSANVDAATLRRLRIRLYYPKGASRQPVSAIPDNGSS